MNLVAPTAMCYRSKLPRSEKNKGACFFHLDSFPVRLFHKVWIFGTGIENYSPWSEIKQVIVVWFLAFGVQIHGDGIHIVNFRGVPDVQDWDAGHSTIPNSEWYYFMTVFTEHSCSRVSIPARIG